MARLSLASLAAAGRTPALDRSRVRTGIVHLGIGVFARAHTATFTEDAMLATGDARWGIAGVTQRSDTVARQLSPQDGLFTVSERGQGARPVRVVSSVVEALVGRGDPAGVVERIAAPDTSVVTLTITEKGYRARGGSLDIKDPDVQLDLGGRAPSTAVGQIVRGLQARRTADAGPIAIVPCDNLPHNGKLTRRLVSDFVAALPRGERAGLAEWVDESVAFPSTMVDRMAPATTEDDVRAVERELGLRDEAAVVAEPFRQWIIEDAFTGPRPAWEAAGAVLTDDVAPWESAKLRLLNASHSMAAYLGLLAGNATISEAIADDAFRTACHRMMTEDALPVIELPAGLDGPLYCEDVLRRFSNPALGHTTAKVGSDGSQKIGPRLLPTLRDSLAAGREPRWAALAVAAWMHRVATAPAAELNDPLADTLGKALAGKARAGARTPAAVVRSLLEAPAVGAQDLAENHALRGLLEHWFDVIDRHGAAGVRAEIR